MSLSDVSMVMRGDLGAELRNIASRPNRSIPGAIKRMEDTHGDGGVSPILNEVLDKRNKRIATISGKGEDMIRTIGDFADVCGRMSNQTRRLNFRKTAWGSIQRYLGGRIKVICSRVSRKWRTYREKVANNSEMKWVSRWVV